MQNCPITGVNIKHFTITVIAGFVFVFGLDFVIHQHLLGDIYEQTKELWRTEEEMQNFFPFMLLQSLILVKILALIFTRNYENKGIGEGIRFGFLMGILMALLMSSSYLWQPIPLILALSWAGYGLVLGLGLGAIFSLTYKN